MFTDRRLPGIHVDTAPPAPAGGRFPRMDVAVFVGIAERGPCHRPVLVESVAGFEAAFGNTVDLAFDPASGANLTSNLGASVRAFFSNGGEKCWVIRVAWTEALMQAWANAASDTSGVSPATEGKFAIRGLLGRLPSPGNGGSHVEIAELVAASKGAWSRRLSLNARITKAPISIADPVSHRWGLRFTCRSSQLDVGDLIELREYDAKILRFAKIIHRSGQDYWAAWSSSFLEITQETPVKLGHARPGSRRNRVDAQFFEGPTSRVELAQETAELVAGSWVHFFQQGESIWLRADTVDGTSAYGPAWQQVGSRLPETPFAATRLSLDLRSEIGSRSEVSYGLGLSPDATNSLFDLANDDAHYSPDENRLAVRRPLFAAPDDLPETLKTFRHQNAGQISRDDLVNAFVNETALESQRPLLRTAFIPLGLDGEFGPSSLPYPAPSESELENSGLVPFDHRLFIDPSFAGMATQEIDRSAIQKHDLDGQDLFGIHAAYDIPGESVGEASILAVPDAVQPGWRITDDNTKYPRPEPGSFSPTNWYDHSGPCLDTPETQIREPDYGGFLDSTVAILARPTLGAPRNIVTNDHFRLSFSSRDEGVNFVLEEASRHDFVDAAEVYRGQDSELFLTDRGAGTYYYRLRTERDGNTSQYSAQMVTVRRSNYVALEADRSETLRIHIAMLRLAAGSSAMTALLGLPRNFRADEAQEYTVDLVTPGFGDTALTDREARSLSYGALFHPWIAGGREDALITIPPEGAVAGHMATTARERGAWIASANRSFENVLGHYPAIAREEWLPSDAARINLVLFGPDGFSAHAARSLSGEADWNQINVRRLFIMLRRLLLNVGNTFLFEPNGPTVRRSIERTLSSHFELLQRLGAFSGRVSSDSYFIRLRNSQQDGANGRILAEIGIAPSRPLEFIEVSLVQQGERLTLEEAA